MIIQNRDGLPDAIIEEKRFFEMWGADKTATPEGWNKPENWRYIDDIPEDRSFGFAICNNTDFLFIDGDHVRNPKTGKLIPWVQEAYKRLTKAGDTYTEISQSGTGFHMVCDLGDFADCYPAQSNGYNQVIIQMDPREYKRLSKEERDKIPKIEFFYHTGGRYALLTGKHKKLYQVAKDEVSASIFNELLAIREEFHQKYANKDFADMHNGGPKFEIDDATRKRILEALPYIPASCSREEWVHIGIALFNCGFEFEVWDEWSKYSDQKNGVLCDKYKEEETPKTWKSFFNTPSKWNAGTIISMAKENGYKTKRDFDDEASPDQGNNEAQKETVPLWVSADNIEPKEAHFLRAGIPANNITVIGGDGGAGKGFFECNLTAAVTRGRKSILDEDIENVFDGKQYEPQRVLLLNTEDSFAHVMHKRLTSAGADLSLVTTINPKGEESILLDRKLIEAIHQIKPALVILDPLQAFVPKGYAMERRNEMRQLLAPLQKCAEEMSVAFLIVMHTNKRMGAYGRMRLADSADMWDIARSVFIMGNCNDEEKTRYISHEKSSYSEAIPTALCKIGPEGLYRVGSTEKKDYDYGRERDKHSGGRPSAKMDEAKDLIMNILLQQPGWKADAKTINSIAKSNDVTADTCARARKALQDEEKIEQIHEGSGKDYKVLYKVVGGSISQ